jgi:hypothetical protein
MAVENVLFLAVEQEQVLADAQRRNLFCWVGRCQKSSAVSRRNTVSLKQSRCGANPPEEEEEEPYLL